MDSCLFSFDTASFLYGSDESHRVRPMDAEQPLTGLPDILRLVFRPTLA